MLISYLQRGIFLALLFVSIPWYGAFSQCVTSSAQSIPDDGILTIDFFASGLTDSDLASPTQGICGVQIDFMHEYLGDLTISLVSPSGTTIQLIGPVTTATGPTNLTRWNISFLPCLIPVSADPGFTDTWSNLQSWQAFAFYTGSYYPAAGCLEDFNSGPANGQWSLVIEDNDPLQIGSITSASLIFCNPAGLQCTQCDPNAGTLSPPTITLCDGDIIQSSDVNLDFGGSPPSPALYSYAYLLLSGNTIIQHGPFISQVATQGIYTVCGLSYLTADAPQIQALLTGGNYDQIVTAISMGTICAELTSSCVNFNITPLPDTIIVDHVLCAGQCFSFNNQTYCAPGNYLQMIDGPGTCDSIFRIEISASALQINIPVPDSLSCGGGNGNVFITSMVTGNTGPFTYQWTTHVGNIVGPNDLASITVNQPGIYTLSIADAQCTLQESVSVLADSGYPQVSLAGGTLTCAQSTLDLTPIYVPTDAMISWSGPMGFSSDQPSINISIPGTYIFTAISQAGCSTSKSVEVAIDTMTHDIGIYIINKNCFAPYATLGNTDNTNISTWAWSGPNNFTDNNFVTNVTDPGLYTLTTTFTNGCQRTTFFIFDGNFAVPDISGPPADTLHCNEMIPLTIVSNTPGVLYGWSGPTGFSSSQSTVVITQHGVYYGTVYADNGCYNQVVVNISPGDDIPTFQSFTDTINCTKDTVQIGIISSEIDVYAWLNYPGVDSLSTISVWAGGVYAVMMTDTNTGCIVTTNISVVEDFRVPAFFYEVDTITCNNPLSELSFVPLGGPFANVYWIMPDQTVVQAESILSDDTGVHELIAVGPNGCFGLWRVRIPFDTLPPLFFLETDTLGCDLDGEIRTILFDPVVSVEWTGPGTFTSDEFEPFISDTGTYVATGFAENGCSVDVSIHVDGDFVPPISILLLDSLGCLSATARFTASSNDSIISYQWKDEAGTVIGTDSIIDVSQPGQYTVELEGLNHCFSLDTIILDPAVFPMISTTTDTLTCSTLSVPLTVTTDIPNATYEWRDINGTLLSQSNQFNVTQTGPFIIEVTGTNGCGRMDTITVPIDTVPPQVIISLNGEVRCKHREFILDGSASGPAGILYQWSASGGNILSPSNLAIVDASDTGYYFLQVERIDNGCTATDSILIGEHPDAIQLAFIEIVRPACSGDSNAQIMITGLQGGVDPIIYELNQGTPQSSNVFQGLLAGIYQLTITDAEGCEYDTTIQVDASSPYFVDAGPDQEIYLGESITLTGVSNILPVEIMDEQWDSSGFVFCQDCPEFTFTPLMTTTYRFQITSVTGCLQEDEVIVYVIEKGKFHIPNIFSPNGDNINDEIHLYTSPGVRKVLKWIIFDRWGDAVFGKTNFDPGDISVFWNGMTPDGETHNPAVFPYLLEIELINGSRELHHGNITLIR